MKLTSLQTYCAVACLLGTVSARDNGLSQGGDHDLPSWATDDKQPVNATEKFQVNGWDVTTFFPGSPSSDWRFQLKVKSDIPVKESYFKDRLGGKGDQFVGTFITLEGPKITKDTKMDESWVLHQNAHYPEKLRHEKNGVLAPNCTGVLSDKCIDALLADMDNYNDGDTQNLNGDTDACKDELGNYFSVGVATGAGNQNSSTYMSHFVESDRYDKGNFTAYDDAISKVHIFVTGWKHNSTSKKDNGSGDTKKKLPSRISCVSASFFEGDSRTLSAATRFQISSAWMAVVFAAFVLLG